MGLSRLRLWAPVPVDFFSVPIPGTENLKPKEDLDVRLVLQAFSFLIIRYAEPDTYVLDRDSYFNANIIHSTLGAKLPLQRVKKTIELITNRNILEENGNMVGMPKIVATVETYRRQVYNRDHERQKENASNSPCIEEKKKEKKEYPPVSSTRQLRTNNLLSPSEDSFLNEADRRLEEKRLRLKTDANNKAPMRIDKILPRSIKIP